MDTYWDELLNINENNNLKLTDLLSKLFIDFYLPNDILTKVDRASMASSLETRVPFLDHELIEYIWKIPHELKLKNGKGKWILRQVLNKYVPNISLNNDNSTSNDNNKHDDINCKRASFRCWGAFPTGNIPLFCESDSRPPSQLG